MSAIGSAIGGVAGAFSQQGDKERAEKQYQDAIDTAKGYNTQVAGVNGSQFANIDPTSRDSMLRALTDYESKYNQGGLDAKARANLAAGTAAAQQSSAQTAAQIQAQAARRGAAQGPAAMIAQQVASQQGAERARQTGLDSAAMAEAARDAALKGQTSTAGLVYGMDANKAAAMDAINRFNVQNAQQNVGNAARQAGQVIGAQQHLGDTFEGRAGNDVKNFGDIGSGVGGVVDFAKGGGLDPGSWLKGAGGSAPVTAETDPYNESNGLNLGNP